MLDGEAIARFGALAADTLHLRTNLGITEIAEVGIRWDDFAIRCDDNLWKRLDFNFLHNCNIFFVVSFRRISLALISD